MRRAEEARQTVRTKDRVEFELLARKIKELRKARKMSALKLCAAIQRDRNYIYALEHGRVYPDFATILDILTVLGADHGEVINEVVTEAAKHSPAP